MQELTIKLASRDEKEEPAGAEKTVSASPSNIFDNILAFSSDEEDDEDEEVKQAEATSGEKEEENLSRQSLRFENLLAFSSDEEDEEDEQAGMLFLFGSPDDYEHEDRPIIISSDSESDDELALYEE